MAREEDNEASEFLYCSHCEPNGLKKPYSSNLPTNMKKHLSSHGIIVEKGIRKIQAEVVLQLEQLHLQAKAAGQVVKAICTAPVTPETVEMTECLKHWKKSGILD